MQSSRNRARYESCLARAHRALNDAYMALDSLTDPGAEEDTLALRGEVARLLEDSVNGKKRQQRQQQLDMDAPVAPGGRTYL